MVDMQALAFDFAQIVAQNWTVWLVTVVLILAAVIDGFELPGGTDHYKLTVILDGKVVN